MLTSRRALLQMRREKVRRLEMTMRLTVRYAVLVTIAVVGLGGCRGCIRESKFYEHTFNRPDCRPRPCPRECPEFELPPGGPYLMTPGMAPPPPPMAGRAIEQITVREK